MAKVSWNLSSCDAAGTPWHLLHLAGAFLCSSLWPSQRRGRELVPCKWQIPALVFLLPVYISQSSMVGEELFRGKRTLNKSLDMVAFLKKKIDGKDTTKSKTCNLYSSSVRRRMRDLNGLFQILFAVISQYVLHFFWQAKYVRIYIHHF